MKSWGCLLRSQACRADESGQFSLHIRDSCFRPGFSSLWGGQGGWELWSLAGRAIVTGTLREPAGEWSLAGASGITLSPAAHAHRLPHGGFVSSFCPQQFASAAFISLYCSIHSTAVYFAVVSAQGK